MIAALCIFLALLAAPTVGQDSQVLAPPSPCPTVFTYDPPGPKPGWWSGVISLSSDFLLHSLWLDIVLDRQAIKLLFGTLAELKKKKTYFTRCLLKREKDMKNNILGMELITSDEDMQIQPGIPISLRFSVQYDTNDRFPKLQAIRLNGIIICNALLPEGQTDSGVKTNINTNKRPVINPSTESINPVSTRPDNRPDPGNISNASDDVSSGNREQTQCGTSTLQSKWPWVATLIYLRSLQNGYYCGGTLLSHRHVITAANCVLVDFSPDKPISRSSLVVRLGNPDLDSILGVQIRLVQEIILSSDYTHAEGATLYSGLDAALLLLHEPLTYTDWVRPVCLWPASQIHQDNIIGKKGWLVGWSNDEKQDLVEQLSAEEIPVVDTETCINSEGYAKYNISKGDNFYCAGTRQETVLCKGVATGNGMVFKMGNSWYLRGHVTFNLERILKTEKTCDPTGYIQFTDLAEGLPRIYGIVSNYL